MSLAIKTIFVIAYLFVLTAGFAVAQTETDTSTSQTNTLQSDTSQTEADTPKSDVAPATIPDASVNPTQDQILMDLQDIKSSINKNTPAERTYDSATAPGTVSLTVLDKNGLPESFQTFVSFVAVGGKTYGGAVDKDGNMTTTLPSGRYYTDVLTTDPNKVTPPDLPGFFLEPEDTLSFGPYFLAEKTEPTQEEKQIQAKLEEPSGLASILNTMIHLLGEILKEVRK
jgi:hypothetical protein